jgi:hypothetical protein
MLSMMEAIMSAGEEQDVIIAGGGTSGVATALCAKENITPRCWQQMYRNSNAS